MSDRNRRWLWSSPPTRKYSVWFLLRAYAPDWIVSIGLGILFWRLGHIKGFRRHFSLTDTSIQYPFAETERINDTNLLLICFVAPFVLISFVSILTSARSVADVHSGWLGLVVSLSITGALTNLAKVAIGRPRPDLISRCQPVPGAANALVFGLATDAICTNTNAAVLNDGFRSLVSGHSSLSFAGLGFLTFFLAGKLHLWDQVGSGTKAWLTVFPMFGATFVAISRTMDSRHHATDVIAGSLLGAAIAYLAYRQYYPPLDSPTSHLCYAPLRWHNLISEGSDQAGSSPAVVGEDSHRHEDDEARVGLTQSHSRQHSRTDSIEMPTVGTSKQIV